MGRRSKIRAEIAAFNKGDAGGGKRPYSKPKREKVRRGNIAEVIREKNRRTSEY